MIWQPCLVAQLINLRWLIGLFFVFFAFFGGEKASSTYNPLQIQRPKTKIVFPKFYSKLLIKIKWRIVEIQNNIRKKRL